MRRISIVIALFTLLLVSICSAQQASDNRNTRSGQNASPIGIDGPIIGGDGVKNYISIWVTPNYLVSSAIYQASGGSIGIGTTTPVAALDVNGGINSATTYGVGGSSVVSIGSPADQNLFLGVEAGANNVAGRGQANTFTGAQAGLSNTTGTQNTFYGAFAGSSNTTGIQNTFFGEAAGLNNTTGAGNTFAGFFAGYANTTGLNNTFSGYYAGHTNITGDGDTFLGFGAGGSNTTGSENTFLGVNAGSNNTTGSYDVYIANQGPASGTESNTIRIGDSLFHHATYIVGIYGSTSSGSVPVYINSSGQLGTLTSSLRFKEQVRDMGDSTDALMKLRPVTFLYKPEYDKGKRTLQYGLIAEEVAQVYPELVAYDNDGRPYSVRYQYITTMLLNEVQKQHRRAEAEAKLITAQEQKIDELEQRLSRLERVVGNQAQTVAQK